MIRTLGFLWEMESMAQIKKLSKVSELLWNELRSLEKEIEGTVIGSNERERLQRKYNILHDLCMVVEDSILFLLDDMLRDVDETADSVMRRMKETTENVN